MENNDLTGIERQLVLQYLMDGNVPVTVTPIEEKSQSDEEKIKPLSSAVFPVALKAEQITVLNQGIILLKNPPQSVVGFSGRRVRVEFYFNRVGLFFITEMKTVSSGLALVVPANINRIEDIQIQQKYDFSAIVYYECSNKSDVNITCVPGIKYELFSRPVWKSIPLEYQKKAKEYLEQFVAEAKKEKNAGNGIQLIPVCRYLTEKSAESVEAVQGRVKPLDILFVDHERIVFAGNALNFPLSQGAEYGVKMSFTLKETPAVSRTVYVTCFVEKVYADEDKIKLCADCRYTTIQEEDVRFLYEKVTGSLFI